MALLDNRYVQVLLVLFAVYVIMNMSKGTAEHLDTVVNVSGAGTEVSVGGETIATVPLSDAPTKVTTQISTVAPAEEHVFSAPVLATAQLAPPQVLGVGPATPPVGSVPVAPLTAVEETLVAAAPSASGVTTFAEDSLFNPQPVDYDEVFNRNDDLEPADLIPKAEPSDLYGDLKLDPSFAGSFLTSPFQLGIETASSKRNAVHDLRGSIAVQQSVVSPWNNPTRISPDTTRKSLADIS